MNVHVDTFLDLVKQEWNYPGIGNGTMATQMALWTPDSPDIAGGRIKISDIDRLAAHPEIKSVTISGLNQETFEYFIGRYGRQLRFIEFQKNKDVADWSLLGSLPELEGVYWFDNRKITRLWDMRENYALKVLVLEDFSKLHDLSGVEKAPALEWFHFGDAIWKTSEVESLRPFIGTKIKYLGFSGKKIRDGDFSFIPDLSCLEVFDFPTNYFTTEEVAWLVAKCPWLTGSALKPYVDFMFWNEETRKSDIPAAIIVGKRKPTLVVQGNEKRIANYVAKFNALVEQYKKE